MSVEYYLQLLGIEEESGWIYQIRKGAIWRYRLGGGNHEKLAEIGVKPTPQSVQYYSNGLDWIASATEDGFRITGDVRTAFYVAQGNSIDVYIEEVLKKMQGGEARLLVGRLDTSADEKLTPYLDNEQLSISCDSNIHAKVIILEGKKHGKILVGSANLTNAALSGDREFCASIKVRKKDPAWIFALRWFNDKWENANGCEIPEYSQPTQTIGTKTSRELLFDFQLEALEALHDYYQDSSGMERSLLVLPTGTGKTPITACWISELIKEDNELEIVWVARQHELLAQARQQLAKFGVPRNRILSIQSVPEYDYSVDLKYKYNVFLVTSQQVRSIYTSGGQWPADIVVYDEAHHINPNHGKETEALNRMICDYHVMIGLTATPWRTDAREQESFEAFFCDGPVQPGMPDRPNCGHVYFINERNKKHLAKLTNRSGVKVLAKRHHRKIETDFVFIFKKESYSQQCFEIENRIGDFDTLKRNRKVVDQFLKVKEERGIVSTLVFACHTDHANRIGELIRKKREDDSNTITQVFHTGDISSKSSDFFHGKKIFQLRGQRSSKYRQDVLEAFGLGEINILIVVGLATEGIDVPRADSILVARPTLSSKLYRQMIGRGLRGPAVGGTEEVIVLDCVDQLRFHDQVIRAIYGQEAYTSRKNKHS